VESRELIGELSDALRRDPWLKTSRVSIELTDRDVLTLSGLVPDVAAKRRAVALARTLTKQRALELVDSIRRRATVDDSDEEVADMVGHLLIDDSYFAECTVVLPKVGCYVMLHDAGHHAPTLRVTCRNREVLLAGWVGSLTQRRFAEVLAWSVPGCESVVNELIVSPPQSDNDAELTEAVRLSLEKDPLIDASALELTTADGAVEIHGVMTSDLERQVALNDIWAVDGVANVTDATQTAPRGPLP
jgi:osmotically-inducible protein OsmY